MKNPTLTLLLLLMLGVAGAAQTNVSLMPPKILASRDDTGTVIDPPPPTPEAVIPISHVPGLTNYVLESTTNLLHGDFAGKPLPFPVWRNREDFTYCCTNFVTNFDDTIVTNFSARLGEPLKAQEFFKIVGEPTNQ